MKPKISPLGDLALLIQFGDEIVLTRYKLGDNEAVMPFITSANIACGYPCGRERETNPRHAFKK
jgi:LamB/YcsF family